jgi:Rrf2 family protein
MAVHVLTVLAYHKDERVTSTCLASSVNTNPVVVRRLLLVLQAAGLVKTRRGAGFGSQLTRSPAQIQLAHIFRAVETDETFVMPRGKPNPECPVGHCIQFELHEIFQDARSALERELARTTLADILNKVHACCDKSSRAGSASSQSQSKTVRKPTLGPALDGVRTGLI